jgi:adenosylcobinamide-phosphate synthase
VTAERLLTLAAAQIIDRLVGEPPPSLHPVVWIGLLATTMERWAPATSRRALLAYGVTLTAVVVGMTSAMAALAETMLERLPLGLRIFAGAALLKPTFAVRELLVAAERVRAPLAADDLTTAREALSALVSRDPAPLDSGLIASAAIESLAENANDSIVAPWFAFVVSGLPGAYAYRAANTLDAMIGYHGRYEHLGKPAARFDDLLNIVPARLTAALIVATAMLGESWQAAWRTTLQDHGATASPNAGWPMAAMAGALGVRLEKIDHYVLGADHRPPCATHVVVASSLVSRLAGIVGCGLGLVGLAGTLSARQRNSA